MRSAVARPIQAASGRHRERAPAGAPRGSNRGRGNASNAQASKPGALGGARTRGTWQERYTALVTARERERIDAVRRGLIADPEKPRSLAQAITPVGTCQDMCAEYERVQRVVQKDVWDEETDPNQSASATTGNEPDESRMVKKFRRAAAGIEEQLPSDLRPPEVLKRTCDYLFNDTIGNASSLAHVHHFVWDRTRAIRNDFSIQQVTKPEERGIAIDCYERIARFHILSLHQLALADKPYSKYDWNQEREQLDRTLLSLMQYYDDSRGRTELPNEAEFRAYCVIFQLQDPTPDLEDRVQTWPRNIVQDGRVQKALDLYTAACNVMDAQGPLKPRANHLIARQDWQRFWILVASEQVSYLMACVAEIYFNLVRRTVLNALFRTFRMSASHDTPDWTVGVLCDLLAFDDENDVYTYCERFGFSFKERTDGEQYLDLTSVKGRTLPEPGPGMPMQSNSSLVEDKRYGRTLSAVINGLAVRQAQDAGLVNDEEDEGMRDTATDNTHRTRMTAGATNVSHDPVDDEESLFIPHFTTDQPRAQTSAQLTNGLNGTGAAQPSVFSAANGGFSFGKPSAFGEPFGALAPTQNKPTESAAASGLGNAKLKFDFLKPPTSSAASTSTPPPLFNFGGNAAGATQDESIFTKNSFGQSSPDHPSPFTQVPAVAPASLGVGLGQPTQATGQQSRIEQNPETSPFPSISAPKADAKPPSPEHVKSQFRFGQPAAAPATSSALSSPSHVQQQPEHTVSQSHSSSQSTSPTSTSPTNQPASPSGFSSGVKRPSFSTDNKPKKPSPLSNSWGTGEEGGAVASERTAGPRREQSTKEVFPGGRSQSPKPIAPSSSAPKKTVEDDDTIITRIAYELVHDPVSGFLKQYIEYAVGQTIIGVQQELVTERDAQEATEFRQFTLQLKYGRRWRDLFWQRRLAKTGRERRERRQRRLQRRGSQELETSSLLDSPFIQRGSRTDSMSSVGSGPLQTKEEMVDSDFRQTNSRLRWSRPITTEQQALTGSKRHISSHDADGPIVSRALGNKRLKSTSHVDERGRISKSTSRAAADLLKRSSFLGFSVPRDGPKNNKDTTKSSYFRLKALGVQPAHDWNRSRGTKRLREESFQLPQTSPPAFRSSLLSESSPEQARSQAFPQPAVLPSTPKTNDEDEALFARLRAARGKLTGGTSLMKSEMTKGEGLARGVSSLLEDESPSMTNARTEARLRASQPASETGSSRDVPAYRLRESKFVPRENYENAIERAKEFRQSRSRETSRPESRAGHQETKGHALGYRPPATKQPDNISQNRGTQAGETALYTLTPDGPQLSFNSPTQMSSFGSLSTPLQHESQAAFSFANHTTQISSQNPFLQAPVPKSLSSFGSQPAFGLQSAFGSQPAFGFPSKQPPINASQDHTIQSSQINTSLKNSFGSKSYQLSQSSFQPINHHSPTPPQQDSYLPSQAISLLSDDEDAPINHQRFNSSTEAEEAIPQLFEGETTEDELALSYGHANPYAALVDQLDEEVQNSHPSDGQAEHYAEDQAQYQAEDFAAYQAQYDEEKTEEASEEEEFNGPNGYTNEDEYDNPNGYTEYEDEAAADGDIDEVSDDTEADEDGSGYDEYEDEEKDYESGQPTEWPGHSHDDPWKARPEKNPTLQHVGNTAEEAIELSD